MEALAIGFSGKMYTLWKMKVVTQTTPWGYEETRRYYSFVKSVSKSLEKAQKLYENAEYIEKLNGHRRSFEEFDKRVWISPEFFRFGKYFRERIDECEDFRYLEWYYEQITDEDHRKYVEVYLRENGYGIAKCGDYKYLVSPLEMKRRGLISDKYKDIIEKLNNNESINFAPEKNLNYRGEYYDSSSEITYKFENYKVNSYDGYVYALPMINDKAKRIKFKNLVLTSYTYSFDDNNSLVITIKDFKFNK